MIMQRQKDEMQTIVPHMCIVATAVKAYLYCNSLQSA